MDEILASRLSEEKKKKKIIDPLKKWVKEHEAEFHRRENTNGP